MTTLDWLFVLWGACAVAFVGGYVLRRRFELLARAQRPYVREFDLTHTSRSTR